MIEKIGLSWRLFKASVQVVLKNPKLLWFPFVTGCMTVVIAVFFISAAVTPVVLHDTGYRITQKEHWQALLKEYAPKPPAAAKHASPDANAREALQTLAIGSPATSAPAATTSAANHQLHWISVAAVASYFLSMFLATFFNVAFYSEIMAAFDGGGVSLVRGFRTAASRLPSILAWSLLAGLIGWLIRRIEERAPLVGRIFAGLVGLAWSVAAVFAIPVIVTQSERNPLRVLQSSARTLKQAWGEGLIGYVGFSAASFVALALSLIWLALSIAAAIVFHSAMLVFAGVAIWLLGVITFSYVSGVDHHVFRCALYKYATEGTAPEPYNAEWMDGAWKIKA